MTGARKPQWRIEKRQAIFNFDNDPRNLNGDNLLFVYEYGK